MFGNCNNLPNVHKYDDAHRLFTTTPWPKTKRRGSALWDAEERPLGEKSQWHYRISQGADAAYYDVCLYHTVMARYHRPAEDGSYVVEYTGHNSVTSSQFMVCVLGISSKVLRGEHTTDNTRVDIPLSCGDFGTRLTYTKDRLLDVSRSMHQPTKTFVKSVALKQWNKQARQQLDICMELFALRLPEIAAAFHKAGPHRSWGHLGKPFKGVQHAGERIHDVTDSAWAPDVAEMTEPMVTALKDLYDACAERVVASKDYRSDVTPITPASVRSTFLKQLENACALGYYATRMAKPLPIFPESLPNKFYF